MVSFVTHLCEHMCISVHLFAMIDNVRHHDV